MASLVHQLYGLIQAKPLSIEILPAEWKSLTQNIHEPFEFTENHLGIPKGVYYKAYLQAIYRFEGILSRVGGLAKEDTAELIEVSCVVLLVNPAHSTCLNRRRSLVEQGVLSEEEELGLIASLQLLPESAKSSVLWSYRRWLLHRRYSVSSNEKEGSFIDDLDDVTMPLEAVARELAIASTASEIYPRNYHAWLHRYKCIHSLASREQQPHPSSNSLTLLSQVLRAEEFAIRKWVEMNVGDYSAMQYLCYVYSIMAKIGIQHIQMHMDNDAKGTEGEKLDKISFTPLEHAVDLGQRYPTHEALWYYLRASYALRSVPSDTKVHEDGQNPYGKNFERWRADFDAKST